MHAAIFSHWTLITVLSKAYPIHKPLLGAVLNGQAPGYARTLLQTEELSSERDEVCFQVLIEDGGLGKSHDGLDALIMRLDPSDQVAVRMHSLNRLRFSLANIPFSERDHYQLATIKFIGDRPVVVAQCGYYYDLFAIVLCDQSWDNDSIAKFHYLQGETVPINHVLERLVGKALPYPTVRLVRIEMHLTSVQHCLDCLDIAPKSWSDESNADVDDEYA